MTNDSGRCTPCNCGLPKVKRELLLTDLPNFSLRRAGKCDGPQHSCGLAQVEAYEDGAILGKRVEHHVAPHPKHTGRCIAWKDQCLSVQLQSDMCCNLQQRKPKCVETFAPVVDAMCKRQASAMV